MFDKEYQSAPVNCKADRLSAFCVSRAKMSAIRTKHDKTTLLVTKGENGHFRTLRAITYKKILNKSNAILAACLHLLVSFGLECRAFACKKIPSAKKWWGGGRCPPCSSPSAAYGLKRHSFAESTCSEDDLHTDCRNVSHYQQQSFSGLATPTWMINQSKTMTAT